MPFEYQMPTTLVQYVLRKYHSLANKLDPDVQ